MCHWFTALGCEMKRDIEWSAWITDFSGVTHNLLHSITAQRYQNLSNTQERPDYEARGLHSSWVWVPVFLLTGSDNFKQFTSLTFILLQGQMKMVKESAFRLLFNQHLLGSKHMHALIYGLAHLDFTLAPWFVIIHFTDERNCGPERWSNLPKVIQFTKLAQLFLLIKCSLRNHLLKHI